MPREVPRVFGAVAPVAPPSGLTLPSPSPDALQDTLRVRSLHSAGLLRMARRRPMHPAEGWSPSKPAAPGNPTAPPARHGHQQRPSGSQQPSHRGGPGWVNLLHELWALHSGLPPLRPALGLVDLHHKEGQDHHGSQEGKNRDGLAHLLVVAARHDPSGNVPGTTLSGRQGSHLRAIRSKVG